VVAAVFTPDGKNVVSTGGSYYTTDRRGELKLWDTANFVRIGDFEGVEFPILGCAVSADGRLVAASGAASVVQIWELPSRRVIARLPGHETKGIGSVFALAFSPNGESLATGDFAGTIRLWNVGTNQTDWRTYEPRVLGSHGKAISCLTFSMNGQRLVSTSLDHTARVWDVPNHRELMTLRGHEDRVWKAAFIQGGTQLVTSDNVGKVKLWDADFASEENLFAQSTQRGRTGYSADGRFLVWQQGTITIWDLARSNATHQIAGRLLALSPSTNTLALISPSDQLEVWSLDSLTQVAGLGRAPGNESRWSSAAYSPDGNRLGAITSGGEIHIWSVAGWEKLGEIKAEADWVLFLPGEPTVLSGAGGQRQTVEMSEWKISTGERMGTFGPSSCRVQWAATSPNGQLVATPDWDTVRLWDVASRRETARFKGGSGMLMALAFSRDGKTIASGTFDGVIQLWNIAARQQAGTLRGHISFVDSLAFSPDGRTLASAGMDNTLRLWKAASWEEVSRGPR
jgi:WD40 repeat protein